MKKSACLIFLFLAVLLLPSSAWASRVRVAQESRPGRGDFDANVLGYIDAYFQREKAAKDFYSYESLSRYSYNGKNPRLRADTSHVFMVNAREGLSLFIVHDKPNDPDGGGAVMRLRVKGDPDGARVLVFDDPYSEWDSFKAAPGGRDFTTWHRWFSCCTDGIVLGTLEGAWKVFLEFPESDRLTGGQTFRGLRFWKAFSASGKNIQLKLVKGRRVRLEPVGSLVNSPAPRSGRARLRSAHHLFALKREIP